MKLIALILFSLNLHAAPLPLQPADTQHPGSSYYNYSFRYSLIITKGKRAVVLLPQSETSQKFPVIVFGNGHAVPYLSYKATMEHLAKKGIAVIFPEYQKSPWDEDFHRMAQDYNFLTAEAFRKFGSNLDESRVIYSGHSYGGAVALTAAGMEDLVIKPKALVLFAVSFYPKMSEYYKNIDHQTAVSLISGDNDEPQTDEKICKDLPLKYKQQIILKSYLMTTPKVIADHGLVRTLGWAGPNVTPLHYYGVWKFLGGAVQDLEDNSHKNTYIYGTQAQTTGIDGFSHSVFRSW